MRITLSSLTFDPLGHVDIDALSESDTRSLTRRVNRVATLDGGVAVNDFGLSDGDRTLTVAFRPSQDLHESLDRMMRLHSRVHVATDDGVYLASIQAMRVEAAKSTLTILPIARLTQD